MVRKALLSFMITLITFGVAAQDPVQFRMTCAPLSDNDMEHRACGVFFKMLKKHDNLEPASKDYDGTFLWYIISSGYHPTMGTVDDDPIIVNIISLSCLKPMAGLCFSVWISGDIFLPQLLPQKASEMVNQSVKVYDEWIGVASDAFENMCPEPDCAEGVFELWTKSLSSASTMNAHPDGDASGIQQSPSK